MSQTTDPIPPPPPSAPVEPAEQPPKRRGALVAVAIGVAVALVAGVAIFALTRSDTAEAQPLALAFEQGQSQTYEIDQTIDAEIASDVFGSESISMDVSQLVSWEVTSVDQEGNATIEVTVSDMSGSVNGQPIPADAASLPPVEIEIAPDGRVLSAGGLALGGAGQTQGFGFPGMGQLTPILPDAGEEVSVGDTWEKEFSQDFPFGEGTIEFSATSTYERDEDVNGRTAAVIVTDLTVPLDFTLSFSDFLETLGPELAGATGAGQLEALEDASIGYAGEGAFTQTSFVDLEAKELLRTQSEGTFDIAMEFSGIPGVESTGTIDFTGTFSQDLELRS